LPRESSPKKNCLYGDSAPPPPPPQSSSPFASKACASLCLVYVDKANKQQQREYHIWIYEFLLIQLSLLFAQSAFVFIARLADA